MLCHACHVHLRRDYPYCLHCGTLRKGAKVEGFAAPELRWDANVFPLTKPVTTIGRDLDNDLVLDHPSVSRRHARVMRAKKGFLVEDLDSFNGTTVDGRILHGDTCALPDETHLHIGDVAIRFAQPRSAAIGSKTMIAGTQHTMLASAQAPPDAPTATGALNARPRRRAGWALKQVPDERGIEQWVLRNTRTGRYLQLDDRDTFLWHQLDGENTVRDLLFAYAQRYGELALPRIERTLHAFADLELVRGVAGHGEPQRPPWAKRLGRAVFKALMQLEVSISGLDTMFGWMYKRFGWRFFTRTAVVALWALILAGLYGMWTASSQQRLFDVAGTGLTGVLIIGAGYLIALAIHEAAHALAVKSYGRTVTRGGFMLMMGMPFAFVDTSDMWFGSRWSRIVVTLSGPLSTAGLAGGFALAAAYVPEPRSSALAYHLAFGLYLNTAYNLNPLMPLDGYQALADALRMPRLREQASAYFLKGIWADLRSGNKPGWKQMGMAIYGFTAVTGMIVFAVLAFLMWRDRLGGLVGEHLPPGLDVAVVAVGIGVVLFPIWYRLGRKAMAVLRRKPAPAMTEEARA